MESKLVEFSDYQQTEEYQRALDNALSAEGSNSVERESASKHKVLARPSGYWNNTGVFKPAGVRMVVSYLHGLWRSNPHWGPTDGGGDGRYSARDSYLRPGAPEGCLIGKIGGGNQGGGSETFALGNHGFVPVDLEGLLWLTVNDEPRGFGDNRCHIWVSIS